MFRLSDTTTRGEKATQAVANVMTGLFAGGVHRERNYEATANPDAYVASLTEYGAALESAVMALVRPALSGAAAK